MNIERGLNLFIYKKADNSGDKTYKGNADRKNVIQAESYAE